jgi:hypothetical protein
MEKLTMVTGPPIKSRVIMPMLPPVGEKNMKKDEGEKNME